MTTFLRVFSFRLTHFRNPCTTWVNVGNAIDIHFEARHWGRLLRVFLHSFLKPSIGSFASRSASAQFGSFNWWLYELSYSGCICRGSTQPTMEWKRKTGNETGPKFDSFANCGGLKELRSWNNWRLSLSPFITSSAPRLLCTPPMFERQD